MDNSVNLTAGDALSIASFLSPRSIAVIGAAPAEQRRALRSDGIEHSLRRPFVRNAGDDAGTAPLFHFRYNLLAVARRDVKTPWPMQTRVSRHSQKEFASEPARSFYQ